MNLEQRKEAIEAALAETGYDDLVGVYIVDWCVIDPSVPFGTRGIAFDVDHRNLDAVAAAWRAGSLVPPTSLWRSCWPCFRDQRRGCEHDWRDEEQPPPLAKRVTT